MILDNFLLLSDSQNLSAGTVSIASTNYIDTKATSGAKTSDDYAGCWYRAQVETAISGATTTGTVIFALQSDSTSAFSAAVTHVASGSLAQATTIAGYTYQARIPTGVQRYIRALITCTTTISAGIVTQFIAKDVDVNAQLIA